jgi:signal transduction histidine kinase
MLKHTQKETRNSIRNLRSPLLENRSLTAALHVLAEQATPPNQAKIEVVVLHSPSELVPDVEYQLLRLAQEALGNAIKHADASLITIRLDATADQIILSVTDDGCGFCPTSLEASSPSHFGMLGMQERAARIGAVWKVHSEPDQGTTITVSLPLKTHEHLQNPHPPR